ncbi:GIY-YIG nuclease family protein [Deinococcus sp. HMF7604]|uniref:GIY-YIG nuclease family protein n=1 Tax=Deinococcus betulae TaxID=2873312 RepID=UPI001CC97A26|nr:GIY-YIG nuclease family protein [Deinococcus betulae]
MSGYVYVLSNESLPGVLKVGMTSRDPFTRAAELTTTGLPMPFRVEFCLMTERPSALELALHQQFAAQRVQAGREFFRVSVREVVGAACALADWPTGSSGDVQVIVPHRPSPAVEYSVVRQSLNVLRAATDASPVPLSIDGAARLGHEVQRGVDRALDTLREYVELGSLSAAHELLALVMSDEVGVRPVDWRRELLNGDARLVVWAVHALPHLRRSLAEGALSFMDDEATFDVRRMGGTLASRSSWVLPSTVFLLTGDLDPARLATYLQQHPSLAVEVAQAVQNDLSAPWTWRSLHVPNADYLRCLCVLRDLLQLTIMPPRTWSLTVKGWPVHTWPPEGPFLATPMAQPSLSDVVKYWAEVTM